MLPLLHSALLAWAALGQEPKPTVLWHDVRSTDATSIDLVFLPDGFRASEQEAFETSVRAAIRQLESHPASFLREERTRWNVHVGFVPSSKHCPGRRGDTARDTAFRTHVAPAERGGLFVSDDAALERAGRALAPGLDALVVILRTSEVPGFATGNIPCEGGVVRLPEGMEGVLLHELGHALFGLGDEYTGALALPPSELGVVAFYPNVTCASDGARFVQLGLERPALVEGALGFSGGVQRAAGPCVMDDSGAVRFCPPCAAVIRGGLPDVPPAPPQCRTVAPAAPELAWRVELAPAPLGPTVLRRFAVLFRLDAPTDDASLRARFAAAQARVSHKTRYMDSPWLGDGSLDGETVFSLEPQLTRLELGPLAPGTYAFAAAQAGLRATSTAVLARFEVSPPAPASAPR